MLRVERGSNLGPFPNRLSDGMVRSSPRVKMVEGWRGSSSVIMLESERCIIA